MCVGFSAFNAFPPIFLRLFIFTLVRRQERKSRVLVEYKHLSLPHSFAFVCTEAASVNMHITYSVTLEISAKRIF